MRTATAFLAAAMTVRGLEAETVRVRGWGESLRETPEKEDLRSGFGKGERRAWGAPIMAVAAACIVVVEKRVSESVMRLRCL